MGAKATGDEAKRLERVGRLVEELGKLQERAAEIVSELALVAAGEPTTAQRAVEALRVFSARWQAAYGTPYQHAGAKDAEAAKRLVKAFCSSDVTERVERYLRDRSTFLVRERHPFAVFVSQVNKYAPMLGVDELTLTSAPVGCRHVPACVSDVAHTERVNRELRS